MAEAFHAWREGRDDLGEELADVAIYLLSVAEMTGVDLQDEIKAKMAKNTTRVYHPLPNQRSRQEQQRQLAFAYPAARAAGACRTLPALVDVFEEDPVVEAAALGAFAVRFRHHLVPAHVICRGEGLEYFQDVSQLRCQPPVRCFLRFAGLFEQLGAQRSPVSRPGPGRGSWAGLRLPR